MSAIDPTTLRDMLAKHATWLRGGANGERADLAYADLAGANLVNADLAYADLAGANLVNTNLAYADLAYANLVNANLAYADLAYANLAGANLAYANLAGADLAGANLADARLSHFQICPEEGSFTAWKKADGALLKLEIPADARRVSALVGRKCRAEFARVLAVFDAPEGKTNFPTQRGCVYRLGEIVHPDSFDDDIRLECTNGIHFFMTRREAEEWV